MNRQRSSSGARIAGDDLQHLVAWIEVLRALLPRSDVTAIAVEARDAGNVDDVVVSHAATVDEYMQVKFAVDAKKLINLDLLTGTDDKSKTSLIQKFHQSWKKLNGEDPPAMQLVTNRSPDPADPLCSLLTGRDSKLTYALERETAKTNAARDELVAHLGMPADDLVDMLEHLTFRCGESYSTLLRHAADLMNGLGMSFQIDDVQRGIDLVRTWVAEGYRHLTIEEIAEQVEDLGLRLEDPMPVLLVQAILDDANPDEADVALNWVEHYIGDEPGVRRELVDNSLYQTTFQPQLIEAAEAILQSEPSKVFVKGAMRLETWFAAGAALPKVRRVELSCRQYDEIWSTNDPRQDAGVEIEAVAEPGRGSELAVVVSVSDDASAEVVGYLSETEAPIGQIVEVRIAAGVGDDSVGGGGHAVTAAEGIRNAVRKLVAETKAERVHLFLATPGSLALFLGHRWNRIAPTTVYADLGAGQGYAPAFRIGA
jgi:hypothetical protein